MRKYLFFVLVVGIVHGSPGRNETEGVKPKLILVAKADGKSFFADDGSYKTWNQAKSYCATLGMKLASITSESQWDALDAAYKAPGFHSWYWISGRDSLELSQFVWDGQSESIGGSYVKYRPSSTGYQLCLQYMSEVGVGTSYLRQKRCDEAFSATLCES